MSNVRRLLVSDRIFFVTANLRHSIPCLQEKELPLIVDALTESRRRMHFLLVGYVVMPDHWHALMWPPFPLTISRAMQSVKWQAANMLNRQRGVRGAVWQHQFWDRFVRHERELASRLDYMHLNPVRKGLVKRPQDWRWSSYNNYSLGKSQVAECPIQIDYLRIAE
jgi:putative transposase